jgi:hypothetical protein
MAEKIAVPGGTAAGTARVAPLALTVAMAAVGPYVSSAITASPAAITELIAALERTTIMASLPSQDRPLAG